MELNPHVHDAAWAAHNQSVALYFKHISRSPSGLGDGRSIFPTASPSC